MWFLKSQINNMHIDNFDGVIPRTYFVKWVSNNNIEFLQNKHKSIKQPIKTNGVDGAYILELHMGKLKE